jgi:hypothetical protein
MGRHNLVCTHHLDQIIRDPAMRAVKLLLRVLATLGEGPSRQLISSGAVPCLLDLLGTSRAHPPGGRAGSISS